jgi:integrase
VTSCRSCLAWGLTYCQGLCRACYDFAGRYRRAGAGACGACGRQELLKRGYCRLCWCQAGLQRPTGPSTPLLPYVIGVRHQQLFLAGMPPRRAAPRTMLRRYGAKGRPPKPPPPAAARPRSRWVQPALVEDLVGRGYRYGRVDLRSGPAPDNPWLAWALHLAHTMAEARGFDPIVRRALNRTLVMLLADHADGQVLRASLFYPVLLARGTSIAHTTQILQTMGIFVDDRPATFDTWLQAKLDGVAPAIAAETSRWARRLLDGGPRSRTRDEQTVRAYVSAVRPALLVWSAGYDHLRDVTRDDVVAHVEALHGHQLHMALVALRSLFEWAKRTGVVFRDPARRVRVGRLQWRVWQPLLPEQIARTVQAATTPQARLFVALAAVHAARTSQIRALQLDDVDLGNRRLTLAGRTRPLDELTYQILLAWLEHRRRGWPNTANPHLLVSARTAVGLGPVSRPWANHILRGLPATLERLRIDRQLEEALTHRADPLHLAVVFDMDESTAIRYAASARQLLGRAHEDDPVAWPPTQVPLGDNASDEHSGSR